MSKWKKNLTIGWLVTIGLPTGLYVFVNFYWWLFDGNVLNSQKMGTAAAILVISGIALIMAVTFPEG